jgi:hypothetical protein
MKTDLQKLDEATPETTTVPNGQSKMSRREALALVGKHTVYTAPAVLAVLALTKSKNAHADCSDPGEPPCSIDIPPG